MAQHDYNIANASFPTVRTDINNVLSAINSSNSGSSRPSSAVAGTIWLDTSGAATAQLLKMYDGADDILLGTINFTANTIDWSDSSVETVTFKQEGTNFTNSLLVGHATTGTLNAAERNTGVGTTALNALTSGDRNTAVGYNALTGETSGQFNTAVGSSALASQVAATYNVGIGYQAGQLISSSDFNTLVGSQAGDSLTGGDCNYNIALGYQSGENLTSGAGNVMIGSVDAASATGDRQLKIAGYDGSTTTTWISGDSSGNLVTPGTVTANGVVLTGGAADFSSVGEHILPSTDDTYNLGSATKQWANIYTGDLHLSNESKSEGNIVDGTTGNWTIQEGAEDLFILNNKSGKKYKFKLEEI